MVKLLFLSGSIRTGSYNASLAREAVAIAGQIDGVDADFIDLNDYPMPIYNGDLEAKSGLPDAAKALKKLFIDADGFFIASPEYNSSISPLLKNSLDWISRKEKDDEPALIAFSGKVAAISAASAGGFGGLRGLVPLRMMLGNIGVHLVPKQLAVSFADKAFDENGVLTDMQHKGNLKNVVEQLADTTKKLKI